MKKKELIICIMLAFASAATPQLANAQQVANGGGVKLM